MATDKKFRIILEAVYDPGKAKEVLTDLNRIADSVRRMGHLTNEQHLAWVKQTQLVRELSKELQELSKSKGIDPEQYGALRDKLKEAEAGVRALEEANKSAGAAAEEAIKRPILAIAEQQKAVAEAAEQQKKSAEQVAAAQKQAAADQAKAAKELAADKKKAAKEAEQQAKQAESTARKQAAEAKRAAAEQARADKEAALAAERKLGLIGRITAQIERMQAAHRKASAEEAAGGRQRITLTELFSNKIEGAVTKNKTLGDVVSLLPPKVAAIAAAGAAAAAGIGLIAVAAKKAYDILSSIVKKILEIGEAGARFDQIERSFKGYVDTISSASDVLRDLRRASHYTISDQALMANYFTLVAGSSRELSVALTDAAPQIMEIAKAAAKLNPTLGDTEFMFQSLARGLKRLEFRLIDNLGLNVKIGQANIEYSKIIGKRVEDFNSEDATLALLNATMAAHENLLEQVGNTTESLVDPYERVQASKKNLIDVTKALIAQWMNSSGAAEQLAKDLDKITAAADRMRERSRRNEKIFAGDIFSEELFGRDWAGLVQNYNDLADGADRMADSLRQANYDQLIGIQLRNDEIVQLAKASGANSDLIEMYEKAALAIEKEVDLRKEQRAELEAQNSLTDKDIEDQNKLNQARAASFVSLAQEYQMMTDVHAAMLKKAAAVTGAAIPAIQELATTTKALTDEQAELVASLLDLEAKQKDVDISTTAGRVAFFDYEYQIEEAREALDRISTSTAEYKAEQDASNAATKLAEDATKSANRTMYDYVSELDKAVGMFGDLESMTFDYIKSNDEGVRSIEALIGSNQMLNDEQKELLKQLLVAAVAHQVLATEQGATSEAALDAAGSVTTLSAALSKSIALMLQFNNGLAGQMGDKLPDNFAELGAYIKEIDRLINAPPPRSASGSSARVESVEDTAKKIVDIESEAAKKIVAIQEKTTADISKINERASDDLKKLKEQEEELAVDVAARVTKLEQDKLATLEKMNEDYQQRVTETTLREESRRSQIMLGFLDKFEKALEGKGEAPAFTDLVDDFIKAKAAAGDTVDNILDVATGYGHVSEEVASAASKAHDFALAMEALAEAELPVEQEIAALQELQRQYEANEKANLEAYGIFIESAGDKARRVHQQLLEDKKTYEKKIADDITKIHADADKERGIINAKRQEIETNRSAEIAKALEEEKRLIGVELANAWEKVGGVSQSVSERFKANVMAMIGDVDSFTSRVQELVNTLEKVAPLTHNIPGSNPNAGWNPPPASAPAPAPGGGGGGGGSANPYNAYGNGMFAPQMQGTQTWSGHGAGTQFVSNDTITVVTQSNSAAVFAANMIREKRRQTMDAVLARTFV